MPIARSEQELRNLLRSPIQKAINYVLDKIYDENISVVHDVVYMAYSPEDYNRTGDLYRAWSTESKSTSSAAQGEFKYDYSKMSIGSTDPQSSNFAQHIGVGGDFYGQDARPYLAELIYQGATGSLFGDGAFRKQRDAWAELNKRIGRRKMKQWMKEGMEAAGLTVQMHNAPLHVEEI
jgi:hypothetical protein